MDRATIGKLAVYELIMGGAKSGKSRVAEMRAATWLSLHPTNRATLVAPAWAGDAEMAARIARHRQDRAKYAPGLETAEASEGLGHTLHRLADPSRLLVVDYLTLWLTQCLMPPPGAPETSWSEEHDALIAALRSNRSPVALVSNEIGLGVMPMSSEARGCVDPLGLTHQTVEAHCRRVTLMVAGCEVSVKDLR